jgi:2-polyprenyl-3-methyl-5-hydroxy-6-metoxy-1,4-benzoquinol methylase
MNDYTSQYYLENKQSEDRLALKFFSRLLKCFVKRGKLLDYGCGTGFFLKKFSDSQFQKFGIEISEYAKDQASINNPQCTMINSLEELEDNSLDVVASLHVMEHLEDPAATIKTFYRKLRKGGVIFLTVPNNSSIGKRLKGKDWFAFRDKTHISLLAVAEWQAILEAVGFTILTIGTDGLWDVPYLKYVPLFLQKLIFYPTAAVQIILNRLFIPIWLGENLILVGKKS